MPDVRVLATDLEFPEGPVVMPDGSVVLVEIRGRRLTRVWPDGRKQVVAEIPGGPNGAGGPGGSAAGGWGAGIRIRWVARSVGARKAGSSGRCSVTGAGGCGGRGGAGGCRNCGAGGGGG